MSETNTRTIKGQDFTEYPMQSGLTVGDLLNFLAQFPYEQEIGFYLIAEDVTPYVGLHPDTGYDPDEETWPIIVTSFVPYDQVP